MKKLSVVLVSLLLSANVIGQIYKSKGTTEVSFFSETPLENISAINKTAISIINSKTDSVIYRIKQTEFSFKNNLMQEHYNENYIESAKYPYAILKGKITPHVDLSKNGTYKVTVTGHLTIHDVTQPRTIEATIIVMDEDVVVNSRFNVKLTDHKIEVPKLVFEKISESILVTVKAGYILFKK